MICTSDAKTTLSSLSYTCNENVIKKRNALRRLTKRVSHRLQNALKPTARRLPSLKRPISRRHLHNPVISPYCSSAPNHERSAPLFIEPATTPVPRRQILRVFVFILAASSTATPLTPAYTCPLHAARIFSAASCAPLLCGREVDQSGARGQAAHGDDGMGAEVWYRYREVRKCECGSFEGLERV
jgi:hypothetical protein